MRIARPLDHAHQNTWFAAVAIAAFLSVVLYTTDGCGGTSPTQPRNAAAVQGVVRNAVSAAPVANATVSVQQGSFSTSTVSDSAGRYGMSGFVSGAVRIEAQATGYAPFSTTFTARSGINTLDVVLQPSP